MEENYVAKLKEIHTENVEGSECSWLPWTVAAEKEGGEDLLKEMVEAGTVLCRRNPQLPAATNIPWPQNQEVQHLVESFSRKKRRVETESNEGGPGDLDTFQESWHAAATSPGTATTNPVTAGTTPPEPKGDAASKAAHSNIKKAHKNKKSNKRQLEII